MAKVKSPNMPSISITVSQKPTGISKSVCVLLSVKATVAANSSQHPADLIFFAGFATIKYRKI
jgi:hypothetical protein